MNYASYINPKTTPQTSPIPQKDMIRNQAGGYTFKVDKWDMLKRFLILGTEGGTYYTSQSDITLQNAKNVIECIQEDGEEVLEVIQDVSINGKAPKNDPAIFALALCLTYGNISTKRKASIFQPLICRTGTHHLQFVDFCNTIRGWGRLSKKTAGNWYTSKSVDLLGYQVIKYRNRHGWSHRDVLRKAHPKPGSEEQNNLFKYIVGKEYSKSLLPKQVYGFEEIKHEKNLSRALQLIEQYELTREMIPTDFLKSPEVWDVLIKNTPLKALLRNLALLTSIGYISLQSSPENEFILSRLLDEAYIEKSRIHPIDVLLALKTYSYGEGFRGSLTWDPSPQIKDALDKMFYMSFENIEPLDKRFLLGIDVSWSMSQPINNSNLTNAEAVAAVAMSIMKSSPDSLPLLFSYTPKLGEFTSSSKLEDVLKETRMSNFGATDCALPMLWAMKKNLKVDVFIILTDNETWYGETHPIQALKLYRNMTGINSKLIVLATTSSHNTIADPSDLGTLDIVGFDSSILPLINNFSRGL